MSVRFQFIRFGAPACCTLPQMLLALYTSHTSNMSHASAVSGSTEPATGFHSLHADTVSLWLCLPGSWEGARADTEGVSTAYDGSPAFAAACPRSAATLGPLTPAACLPGTTSLRQRCLTRPPVRTCTTCGAFGSSSWGRPPENHAGKSALAGLGRSARAQHNICRRLQHRQERGKVWSRGWPTVIAGTADDVAVDALVQQEAGEQVSVLPRRAAAHLQELITRRPQRHLLRPRPPHRNQ